MTDFIDLIYCSGLDGGLVVAYAPMSACIKKGDIVCIDGMTDYYMALCKATIMKDSEIHKFITEVYGDMYKITDKYSHQELVTSGNGDSENE